MNRTSMLAALAALALSGLARAQPPPSGPADKPPAGAHTRTGQHRPDDVGPAQCAACRAAEEHPSGTAEPEPEHFTPRPMDVGDAAPDDPTARLPTGNLGTRALPESGR